MIQNNQEDQEKIWTAGNWGKMILKSDGNSMKK